jgi:SAM-dependent methyltransferase
MSFSADWLTLREPYDLAARNPKVLDAVAAALSDRTSVGIVDLACGTGSTLRAVAPRLGGRQNWRLVDNDLSLLARAANVTYPRATVTAVPVDLARDLEAALDGPLDLVTTSALLDLVSGEWLERLAVEAAARRLPVYAALSYDGCISFDPAERFDDAVVNAVNAHQRRDKGFGPALGPAAAEAAVARFKSVGYEVVQGAADWHFGPSDREVQNETLSGWATAARETGLPLDEVAAWFTRRRDVVAAGHSTIVVGHLDLFARPTGTR